MPSPFTCSPPSSPLGRQAASRMLALEIWCQGVKVLPSFCKNLSYRQDYARHSRKHPSILYLWVFCSVPWKLPVELARLQRGKTPGSRFPDLPRIPRLHPMPVWNSREPQTCPWGQKQSKQYRHVTGNHN